MVVGVCFLVGLLNLLALPPALRLLSGYRSPITDARVTGAPGDPLTERVVLVVLSGMSTANLDAPGDPWRFVQLRRLAGEGAYGMARAVQPSGDAPTWAALLSGADPEVSGIVNMEEARPLPVPSLFDAARAAGRRGAVVTSRSAWRSRAPLARPDETVLTSSGTVAGTATTFLGRRSAELVVVLLDTGRTLSVRPEERWSRLDAEIAAIAGVLDPGRDTLLVTGDHGLLPDGSSGGNETRLVDTPFVVWGRGVAQAPIGRLAQRDVAPTIATLLGLAYSPYGGAPSLDALQLPLPARSRELVRLLEAKAQAQQVAPVRAAEARKLLVDARGRIAGGDWSGAAEAARQGLAALDAAPPVPAFWSSFWLWGVAVPLLLLGLGRLASRYRRPLRRLAIPFAGLAGYLLAWTLIFYVLAGKSLSLSAIYGDWNANLLAVGLWSALALAAVAAGIGLVCGRNGPQASAIELGLAAILVLASLGGFAGLYLVVAGLPNRELPNLTGWTALLLALAQGAGAGIGTPVAMLVAAAVGEVVGRGR